MAMQPMCLKIAAMVAGLSGLVLPGAAGAQSCPTDLSALSGQIQTADLQTLLSTPIDDIVAKAGSLDQAISNVSQSLSRYQGIKANLGNADDAATQVYADEVIKVITAELQALQCRKTN